MTLTTARVMVVAVAAGVLGALASLWWNGSPLPQRAGTGQHEPRTIREVSASEPPIEVKPAQVGEPMPTIELADLHGQRQSLPRAYAGRPLLINVWASWCGPCIEEMPELDRYARAQAPAGIQVIGLALDTPENIRQFLGRVPVAYPILVDTPGPADASVWLGNRKGVLPYSVLVGADGKILKQKVGPFAPGEIDAWSMH